MSKTKLKDAERRAAECTTAEQALILSNGETPRTSIWAIYVHRAMELKAEEARKKAAACTTAKEAYELYFRAAFTGDGNSYFYEKRWIELANQEAAEIVTTCTDKEVVYQLYKTAPSKSLAEAMYARLWLNLQEV